MIQQYTVDAYRLYTPKSEKTPVSKKRVLNRFHEFGIGGEDLFSGQFLLATRFFTRHLRNVMTHYISGIYYSLVDFFDFPESQRRLCYTVF